jgi:phage tail sheath protein FI
MPVTPTYPGVYIEEVPSGVRTIVGVATSIAAFLGKTAFGEANEPIEVNGIGEFEREFGPVLPVYPVSVAVRDFFQNGGARAIVVRLYKSSGPAPKDGVARPTVGDPAKPEKGLKLKAVSPGEWGGKLRANVDFVPDDVKKSLGFATTDIVFNLTVRDTGRGLEERHQNLSIKDSPRRVDQVLATESSLVRWDGDWPTDPNPLPEVKDGEVDFVTAKEVEEKLDDQRKALAAATQALRDAEAKIPPVQADIDAAKTARDTAQDDFDTAAGKVKVVEDALGALKSADLTALADYGDEGKKTGLYALEKADLFNLLCIPPDTRGGTTPNDVYKAALEYCVERRAMLLVDPPATWDTVDEAADEVDDLGLAGNAARNAALYFPRLLQTDPEAEGAFLSFVPCGAVAGIMARTDVERGVWKAPAGVSANLSGVQGLEVPLTDEQNGRLNKLGVNCLRRFPASGNVVWGARTLRGADQLADEYKYVPVRRLALFLEESLFRGTKWVVFEPNDEPLWAQIRLNVGAFLQNLFRQGAFQGRSPREAYFVKCDKDTTTQNDRNLGIVNIVVGFAPLKPAEFVLIKIQQLAGQIET